MNGSIVVRLTGGLGNQMFGYAAGRSLALKTGSSLVLDTTAFTLDVERRAYALDDYGLAAEVRFDGYAYPPNKPAVRFPRVERPRWIERAAEFARERIGPIGRKQRQRTFSVFAETSFDFDPRFCDRGPQTYLVGYFQSERYFAEAAGVIREELTYRREPDPANAQWLARIRASNAVCVHVRRGDYLLPAHFEHHGVCSADYYRRAMRLIRERVADPQFFVFSDDWPWCRESLADDDVFIVEANAPGAGPDELRLMAACRHHVIANSSLSWWGAWLAARPDQIAIAPTPWFTKNPNTPDLFPAGWVMLPRE
jgi:hypothetical protein